MMRTSLQSFRVLAIVACLAAFARAAEPATRPAVYRDRVVPHWTDATHFWYRNALPDGTSEVVTIDAAAGTRTVTTDEPRPNGPPSTGPMNAPPTTAPDAVEERGETPPDRRSPDGRLVAGLRGHNVCVGTSESEATPVTTDGTESRPYDRVFWSPDGRSLVAYRVERGDHKAVYRLQSSPPDARGFSSGGAGRAVVQHSEYPLPGDRLDSYELTVIDVETSRVTKPAVDPVDADEWGSHPSPRPRWRPDGRHFTYEKYDRGHQRVRVIEIDAATGDARTLLDERSETFIWTAHVADLDLRIFNYLKNGREVIYVSERSGTRHLYLLNLDDGALKPITSGPWVLRGVARIDEKNRQAWFAAGGVYPGQDPYFVHYGRVNFDGSGLTWLTDADGQHDIDFRRPERQLSPDGMYLVIRHSRVDLPPVTELRRTDDGRRVMELERAEVQGTWRPLESFHAKGRDGETDIWGVICRPRDFDPGKTYPIVESVYAGPQGAFVPKSFQLRSYYERLADLGFVVVQADGMGTAFRSKAFHDVCWKNLADGGFPDRIAWIKAAAAKYPYMDATRVGIFGTSAGGQNAAAALIFHNDFYKAAVANCGCHDNRLDKISWNEQWMGYPVGPHYSACSNIDNAARLKGRLQLVLGEMDDNVPVESTYRLVNALVRNGKDFDFVLIPNAGHGAGSPITERKLQDFFVRHLQGVEPTNPN